MSHVKLSDGRTIELSMLPLRSYGDLMITLQSSFKEMIAEWDGASNDEIVDRLPGFIANHLPEAAKIVEIGTRKQITADELLDDYGLADAIDLVAGIVEVNDVDRMVDSVKKAAQIFRKQKIANMQPAAAQPMTQPIAQ